jgi:hypothetical protein
MKTTRVLATLAVALLMGCSDDDETTTTPEIDSAIDDTGSATETGGDETSMTDGTVEETTTDGSTTETTAGDAPAADARDAADAAPKPMIKCGSSTCDPATQVCCGTGGGGGGATCAAKSDAGVCPAKFACSNGDTCGAGMKCCAVIGVVSGSECKAACTGLGEIQLCDSNDECPASADAGDGGATCTAITGTGAATGYSRCE